MHLGLGLFVSNTHYGVDQCRKTVFWKLPFRKGYKTLFSWDVSKTESMQAKRALR
jgi:hypothetical protein